MVNSIDLTNLGQVFRPKLGKIFGETGGNQYKLSNSSHLKLTSGKFAPKLMSVELTPRKPRARDPHPVSLRRAWKRASGPAATGAAEAVAVMK